jgi:hypothetical protein
VPLNKGGGGGSKSLRAVDFVSRFVLLIKFKFKIIFNSYYESRCKINGPQKSLNPIFS